LGSQHIHFKGKVQVNQRLRITPHSIIATPRYRQPTNMSSFSKTPNQDRKRTASFHSGPSPKRIRFHSLPEPVTRLYYTYPTTFPLKLKIAEPQPPNKIQKRKEAGRRLSFQRHDILKMLTKPSPTKKQIRAAPNLALLRHYPATGANAPVLHPHIEKSARLTKLLQACPLPNVPVRQKVSRSETLEHNKLILDTWIEELLLYQDLDCELPEDTDDEDFALDSLKARPKKATPKRREVTPPKKMTQVRSKGLIPPMMPEDPPMPRRTRNGLRRLEPHPKYLQMETEDLEVLMVRHWKEEIPWYIAESPQYHYEIAR
jgi:hypothetical protein